MLCFLLFKIRNPYPGLQTSLHSGLHLPVKYPPLVTTLKDPIRNCCKKMFFLLPPRYYFNLQFSSHPIILQPSMKYLITSYNPTQINYFWKWTLKQTNLSLHEKTPVKNRSFLPWTHWNPYWQGTHLTDLYTAVQSTYRCLRFDEWMP